MQCGIILLRLAPFGRTQYQLAIHRLFPMGFFYRCYTGAIALPVSPRLDDFIRSR